MEKLLVTVDAIEGDKAAACGCSARTAAGGCFCGRYSLSFLQFRAGTDGGCAATGRGAAQAASAEMSRCSSRMHGMIRG